MDACDLAALVRMVKPCSLYKHMAIFMMISFPSLSGKKKFFFDIADPGRKSAGEQKKCSNVISKFSEYGDVVSGYNENEAHKLFELVIGKETDAPGLEETGQFLFDEIHSADYLFIRLTRLC